MIESIYQKHRFTLIFLFLTGFLTAPLINALQTGPQKSGNEFAADYSVASDREKADMLKELKGSSQTFYFRYLHVLKKETTTTNGFPCVIVQTTEPSSGMYVNFKVVKKVSLGLIDSIQEGEGVAVTGRIVFIDKECTTIVLEPVIVRHKDKLAPKRGKELRGEVDPSAIKAP